VIGGVAGSAAYRQLSKKHVGEGDFSEEEESPPAAINPSDSQPKKE
jgi:hypothetical protein